MGRISKKAEKLIEDAVRAGRATLSSAKVSPTTTAPPAPVAVIRFTIPPSANNLFLNKKRGRGRVKSPEYREWIKANTETARTLTPPAKYPVRVCYRLCGKVNRSRDGFNVEKAMTDLLVAEGVLQKDSLMCVTGGRWEYAPSDAEPHVLVWLEEI